MEPTPAEVAARKAKLRAALDGVELLPDITQDEKAVPETDNRDKEFIENKPPHHG